MLLSIIDIITITVEYNKSINNQKDNLLLQVNSIKINPLKCFIFSNILCSI